MQKQNREQYIKNYRLVNKERIKTQLAAYYQANKEEIKLKEALRYQANKERRLVYSKEYRETHREEHSARHKAYYNKNKQKVRESQKRYRLKIKYGLDNAGYSRLLQKQDSLCAICKQPYILKNGVVIPLYIDHKHSNNAVRGLLCGRCNSGLGYFGDSITNLQEAVQYLLDR